MNSSTSQPGIYEYGRLTAAAQLERVSEAVTSGRLGAIGGTQVPELEELVALRTGRAHALATSSATTGIEIALRAVGVRRGAEVIIPAVGWVSVGAAVATTGAAVRVAPVTQDLTPTWNDIATLLTQSTAAVVLAHLRGMPAPEIEHITAELRLRDIPLVEDCAQAWGVHTDADRPAGAYGTVAVFSFQTYKLVAAGEGGVVVCDDPGLAAAMRAMSGDTRASVTAPIWRGNSRMSEVTAALAIPQLRALDQLTSRLRPLQQSAAEFLSEIVPAERVRPDTEEAARSNGMHVGVWLSTSNDARALCTGLNVVGLRGWHPTAGDLHTHEAWPVKAEASSVDLTRYLDLQIPALDPAEHPVFLDLVRTAVEKAGLLTRSPR